MRAEFHPLHALLLTVSGWVNRHQQHVIEYLVEENRVLKERPGGKALRLYFSGNTFRELCRPG